MSTEKFMALCMAFGEIETATHALADAKDAFARASEPGASTQDFEDRLKQIRGLSRKMQRLAEEEEAIALKHCDHSGHLVTGRELIHRAGAVAEEGVPEQEAAIRECLDRIYRLNGAGKKRKE